MGDITIPCRRVAYVVNEVVSVGAPWVGFHDGLFSKSKMEIRWLLVCYVRYLAKTRMNLAYARITKLGTQ